MPMLPPETTVMDSFDLFVAGFRPSKAKRWNRYQLCGDLAMTVYGQSEEGPFRWIVTDKVEDTTERSDRDVEFDSYEEAFEDLYFRFFSEE